jgi:hypothetical protein
VRHLVRHATSFCGIAIAQELGPVRTQTR